MQSKTPHFEIIEMLAIGPESQIDYDLGKRMKTLRGKPTDVVIKELREIIADSLSDGLASKYVINVLQMEYNRLTSDHPKPELTGPKLIF